MQKIEQKIDTKADAEDTHQIITMLDGIAKRMDDDDGERAAMNRQLQRHEAWHEQEAQHIGIKLSYDA